LDGTPAGICGHRCPAHPDWTSCQLAPGHPDESGHRDSAGPDVQHVWQDHGHHDDDPAMSNVDDATGMSKQDTALWRRARTLADLGELTAQWLEGTVSSIPGVVSGYGPDEETIHLIPILAAANRAGFVTDFSQPGEDDEGWIQRAAVAGFASPATFAALTAAAADADLMLTAARAAGDDWGTPITVTVDNGRENTWAGGAQGRSAIWDTYGCCCHPSLVETLCDSWQLTLADPQWGRDDHLWPVLQAFASAQHMSGGTSGVST
jgi:hypothetical protein